MSLHVIVGAGPVGTATAQLLAEQRRAGPARHPRGHRPAAPGDRADRRRRRRRRPADRPHRRARSRSTTARTPPTTGGRPTGRRWPPRCSPPPSAPARCSSPSAASTGTARSTAPMTEDTPLAATGTKGAVRNRMWPTRSPPTTPAGPGSPRYAARTSSAPRATPCRRWCCRRCSPGNGSSCRRTGRPAQLDVHRRRGAYPGRRRHRRAGLGRAWHVPSTAAVSARELAGRAAQLVDAPRRGRPGCPTRLLWLGGLTHPFARELRETAHQFARPSCWTRPGPPRPWASRRPAGRGAGRHRPCPRRVAPHPGGDGRAADGPHRRGAGQRRGAGPSAATSTAIRVSAAPARVAGPGCDAAVGSTTSSATAPTT